MDRRELEERLRSGLKAEAETAVASPQAWARIERRVRRQPWRRVLIGAAGLAVLVAAAVVGGPRLLTGLQRNGADDSGTPSAPSPSQGPSHGPSQAPSYFPGFWPAATFEEAEKQQKDVDAGHQPWRLDPAQVVQAFAADLIGWKKIKLGDVKADGSTAEGWTATVTFQPYVGEPGSMAPGTRHTARLLGLQGREKPAWFVTSLASDHIVVKAPQGGELVSSPVSIAGVGLGFEGTINTEIRDDTGRILHPRPGRDEGFVTGGATEMAPFQGRLGFESPSAPAGILILKGSSGLEGPEPDWTIVRMRFNCRVGGPADGVAPCAPPTSRPSGLPSRPGTEG